MSYHDDIMQDIFNSNFFVYKFNAYVYSDQYLFIQEKHFKDVGQLKISVKYED